MCTCSHLIEIGGIFYAGVTLGMTEGEFSHFTLDWGESEKLSLPITAPPSLPPRDGAKNGRKGENFDVGANFPLERENFRLASKCENFALFDLPFRSRYVGAVSVDIASLYLVEKKHTYERGWLSLVRSTEVRSETGITFLLL